MAALDAVLHDRPGQRLQLFRIAPRQGGRERVAALGVRLQGGPQHGSGGQPAEQLRRRLVLQAANLVHGLQRRRVIPGEFLQGEAGAEQRPQRGMVVDLVIPKDRLEVRSHLRCEGIELRAAAPHEGRRRPLHGIAEARQVGLAVDYFLGLFLPQ